jgi:CheY-like chemotaxis protein
MSTILIVDDEADLRDAIAFDFRRKKFNVITAGSGREAMKVIEAQPVDIVLSDVRMADGDGVELLDWIKERNVFIPVVMFITGYADITLEEAYDKGAEAVFAKPFDRKVLMSTVERAIQPPDQKFERRSSRVDVNVPVKLSMNGQSVQSQALNLGRGGLFVALDSGLPRVHEEVEFEFGPLPGSDIMLSGRGIVRWVRESGKKGPAGCGIEFMQLDPSCASGFLRFINAIKTKAFIPIK